MLHWSVCNTAVPNCFFHQLDTHDPYLALSWDSTVLHFCTNSGGIRGALASSRDRAYRASSDPNSRFLKRPQI
jgi:hypothetical protein